MSQSAPQHRTATYSHHRQAQASLTYQSRHANQTRRNLQGATSISDTPNTKPKRKKSRYIPSLDGLRALAVIAVIFYHMGFPWAKGGLLGVTVFFVLSGYLITGLLISEFDSTKTIDLAHFWLRRVRRLVPAIVTVVVCVTVLCTLFNHVLLTKMRPDIIASLFFFNNWWQIFHNVSYFEALGQPSPLTHFWSLAIEEQFYVVWPLLLLAAFKLGANRKWMRRGILVLAGASVITMAVLYVPGDDPSRVYYGTDTRAFSLLIGAWLAFAWPSADFGSERARHIDAHMRGILNGVGIVALIALVAMLALMSGISDFPYRGGIALASVTTAVLIAILVHPATVLFKAFSNKALVWIGVRSYGMYLWHYPIVLLMAPLAGSADGTPPWLAVIEIAVIFGISAASYTFIENPIRKGAIGRLAVSIRAGETTLQRFLQRKIVPFAGALLLCGIAIGGVLFVPDASAVEDTALYQDETAAVVGLPTESDQSDADASEGATAQDAAKLDVLMIGDSVAKKCIYTFPDVFPYGALDAALNRQLTQGIEIYQSYESQGIVGNIVVFCLGNNGTVTEDDVSAAVEAVGSEKQIFFVSLRNDTGWSDAANAAFANAAERNNNVHIIDWHAESAGHSEYFEADGMHLTPQGGEAYTQMIFNALYDYLPERSRDPQAAAENAAASSQTNNSDSASYMPTLPSE